MVTTLEAIQLINDMNAKIFFLVVIGLYCAFAFYKYNKIDWNSELNQRAYKLGLFIFSRVTIFFYPLAVVTFLHINTTLEEMIIFIAGFYSIIMVMTFGFLFMLGFEKLLNFMGIKKGGLYK